MSKQLQDETNVRSVEGSVRTGELGGDSARRGCGFAQDPLFHGTGLCLY